MDAPLQRVQMIKGWLDEQGQTHEKVVDIACADGLTVDSASGRCPDNGASDIKTVVRTAYAEANPNLARFLDQLVFSSEEQSGFILDYSLKERDLDEVAHDWLAANPDRLAEFLADVTTRDGEDALAAVKASL